MTFAKAGQAVRLDRIAVVLGGDIHMTGLQVLHRLVGTPVTMEQLFTGSALAQCHELVTQPQAQYRSARTPSEP